MEQFIKMCFPKSSIMAKENNNFFSNGFWFSSHTLTIKNNREGLRGCSSVVVAVKIIKLYFNE